MSNGTIVPLLDQGTIRPLDDLVAEHGDHLGDNQFVRVGGEVMAVAMMINTQHLMDRMRGAEKQRSFNGLARRSRVL